MTNRTKSFPDLLAPYLHRFRELERRFCHEDIEHWGGDPDRDFVPSSDESHVEGIMVMADAAGWTLTQIRRDPCGAASEAYSIIAGRCGY